MEHHDTLDDGQADTNACRVAVLFALFPRFLRPIKLFSDEGDLMLWYAPTIVREAYRRPCLVGGAGDRQCRVVPRILYEVGEDIVHEGVPAILVDGDHIRCARRDHDPLTVGLQHALVLIREPLEYPDRLDPVRLDLLATLVSELFVLHERIRDADEPSDLVLEVSEIRRIGHDDPVGHAFEIALYRGDRGLDLMAKVRQKVRADLLLTRKVLIEIIDHINEHTKLVSGTVLDALVLTSGDDVADIINGGMDRAEAQSHPYIRPDPDEDEQKGIHKEHRPHNPHDEYTLGGSIVQDRKGREIPCKSGDRLNREVLLDRGVRDTVLLERVEDGYIIDFRIMRKFFEGTGQCREILEDKNILLDRFFVEVSIVNEGRQHIKIYIRRAFLHGLEIIVKIERREISQGEEIRREDQ